jgi:hypothetical protein
LWRSQGVRIEVWLEKDALADVIWPVVERWGVPLAVSRGVSSETFIYNAAMDAKHAIAEDVHTKVFTLFDLDQGGERGHCKVVNGFRDFAPDAGVTVERLAVTIGQATAWDLATRPPKPRDQLTRLVEGAITRHVDPHAWHVAQVVEDEERRGLMALAQQYRNGNEESTS